MTSQSAPSLFLSHGAPTMALEPSPARAFLTGLGRQLPAPKAILVASAHWQTDGYRVSTAALPRTIHDFGGFGEQLHRFQYPAPGSPEVAHRAASLLRDAGIGVTEDPVRGFDHGVWVPLSLLYPGADIPVVSLSLDAKGGPDEHYALGQALAPLRGEGVMIVGSGSLTHDLGSIVWPHDDERAAGRSPPAPAWVSEFADWFAERVAADDRAALLNYRHIAPHATRNHPTDEHLLPFFVALGAGGKGTRLHSSNTFGVLAMDAYGFD